MFDKDFVWGVATSAYQIEGGDATDGRGKCIWDTFAEEQRCQGADAKVACDHIHRYREDIALMKELGVKAYRFSVSWARIMPNGTGEVNQKAIEMYRDMIQELRNAGIEPYLTMYHWELPQALEDIGGWENETIIDAFAEYAKVIAENFSDLVTYFFTINEPQCVVGLGYLHGKHAPGKQLSYRQTFLIAHHVLKAHGTSVKQLRKYAKRPILIGYAPTCSVAMPYSDAPEDIEAARKEYFSVGRVMENWTWNVAWFSDPVFFGHYPEEGLEAFAEYLPEITKEDMELISQPIDFLGQNIYNGYYVKAGKNGEPVVAERKIGYPETSVGWPVVEDCLYWGMKFIYERYRHPVYITENGIACSDVVSLDGKVHDSNRIDFLDRYLSSLQKAADEGVDIRGYFLWSFMDNFEWERGYHGRFGIVYVDFESLERIPKDSAYWYRDTIACNGENLYINRQGKTK